MTEQIPQEVIVVEGKSDTQRLRWVYGPEIKTIETGGSAINQGILDQIQHAQDKFGVIVFTDPDYPGHKIRQSIDRAVPGVQHAYLQQDQAQARQAGRSLGVEHASPEAIRQALSSLSYKQEIADLDLIPTAELMRLGLIGRPDSKTKRQALADHFSLGRLNGKQLQRQLAQYNISHQDLLNYLQEQE